jgi:hypothetical protein
LVQNSGSQQFNGFSADLQGRQSADTPSGFTRENGLFGCWDERRRDFEGKVKEHLDREITAFGSAYFPQNFPSREDFLFDNRIQLGPGKKARIGFHATLITSR